MRRKLAFYGGQPVRDITQKPWPAWSIFGEEEKRNLLAVFESGKWFFGERVKEFEEKFAAFQQAKFGISCTSGTTALEMALYTWRYLQVQK